MRFKMVNIEGEEGVSFPVIIRIEPDGVAERTGTQPALVESSPYLTVVHMLSCRLVCDSIIINITPCANSNTNRALRLGHRWWGSRET